MKTKRLVKSRMITASTTKFAKLPSNIQEMYKLAQEKFILGETNRAISILTNVIMEAPNLPDGYELLGSIHEEKGQIKDAYNFYMIASQKRRGSMELFQKIAEIAYQLGYYSRALEYINRLLKKTPSMIAYTQKLQILTGLGDYKRANEFVDDIIMMA